jgi:hypothetical protein
VLPKRTIGWETFTEHGKTTSGSMLYSLLILFWKCHWDTKASFGSRQMYTTRQPQFVMDFGNNDKGIWVARSLGEGSVFT